MLRCAPTILQCGLQSDPWTAPSFRMNPTTSANPTELNLLDADDYYRRPMRLCTIHQPADEPDERRHLFARLEQAFNDYGELTGSTISYLLRKKSVAKLLDSIQGLRLFEKPGKQEAQSVTNFFRNEAPLTLGEEGWTRQREDLVALRRPKEPDWLEWNIERVLYRVPWAPVEVSFTDPVARIRNNAADIGCRIYSSQRSAIL